MDIKSIGQKIKQKYPYYRKFSDEEIGNALLRKLGQVQPESASQSPVTISSVGNINPLIQKYFPQDQWENALRVIQGESGGNPQAIGDKYPIKGILAPSYGLFQIRALPGRPAPEQLLNPEFNVAYAANLFKEQGWRPWTAARKLGLVK